MGKRILIVDDEPNIVTSLEYLMKREGFEVEIQRDLAQAAYRKLVFRDDKLVGFILLNQFERAGIFTDILRRGMDVSAFRAEMLRPDFGYVHLPKEHRRAMMTKGMKK
jgi:DNA-binding NtrC family response regulator